MKDKRMQLGLAVVLGLMLTLGLVWAVNGKRNAAVRAEPADATTCYVDVGATGSGTGADWANAFTNLQDALDVAAYGDQIWVAQGLYTPTNVAARTATFSLTNGVEIYGGFPSGGGDGTFGARDWETYITILSGDLGGDDITDGGVITDTANIVGDNAYHVVTSDGVTETAVLDGFTITGGDADDTTSYGGGGIFNWYADPTLARVIIVGNSTTRGGGGMNSIGGDFTLTEATFSSNQASSNSYGGGLYNSSGSPALITVTFSSNSAYDGGGMYHMGGHPFMLEVTFTGNQASDHGGGMYIDGLMFSQTTFRLESAVFAGNHADHHGGGLFNGGAFRGITSIITDVLFSTNSATNTGGFSSCGGGLYNGDDSLRLTNVAFNGNHAMFEGGGICNAGDNLSLTNIMFSGNAATSEIGVWGDGGGIYNSGAGLALVNSTVISNRAKTSGGGIYIHGDGDDATIANSIFWDNADEGGVDQSAQIHVQGATGLSVTYSLVQGGAFGGDGNISQDPLFVRNPDAGDGDWTTLVNNDYGDLHLQANSPAIDAGDNTAVPAGIVTDLDGCFRFADIPGIPDTGNGAPPIVDMGAYERSLRVYLPAILRN